MRAKAKTHEVAPGHTQAQANQPHVDGYAIAAPFFVLIFLIAAPIIIWKVLRGWMGYRRVVIVRKER